MGSTPSPAPQLAAGTPVPVAFVGRVSTLNLQNPRASLNRQARECADKLPAGWYLAAWYWDIESGGLALEDRGQSDAWEDAGADLPRDGGLADLLAEARSPAPRFAVVICEDIERSARDSYTSQKLERELAGQGIPLFATDEPISIDGMNATTILVRRVKQGVAEWFRLQLKEKVWRGLREHALDGWNIGRPPIGYTADRRAHPAPAKAAQGRTVSRLALDPEKAPAIAAIFDWRTRDDLGVITIWHRLAESPGLYPPPPGGWTSGGVYAILANPKYTGHQVFGRRHHRRAVPPDQWLWTPEPVHPAIITRETWDKAQKAGAAHATAADPGVPDLRSGSGNGRTYPLKSRIRCRECRRRMAGATRPNHTYYLCPWRPATPAHAAACPDHPVTVAARQDHLMTAITQFIHERILGPERAALLAAATPGPAGQAAENARQAADLARRLRRIEAAENAAADDLAAITASPEATPAARTAIRTRIIARFNDYETQRADITRRQAQLTATKDDGPGDPALLTRLPQLPDILADAPPALVTAFLDAFDIQALYNPADRQVTIRATITTTTPATVTAIINDHLDHLATQAASSQLSALGNLIPIRTDNRFTLFGST